MSYGVPNSLIISIATATQLLCLSSTSFGQDLEIRVRALEEKVKQIERQSHRSCLTRVDGVIPEGTFIFVGGEKKRPTEGTYEVQIEKKHGTSYACTGEKAVAKVFASGKSPECFYVVVCASDLITY